MAYKIIAKLCTNCAACLPRCPNQAISFNKKTHVIDPGTCQECEGQFDMPQCLEVCPIEDCVVPA